MTALPIDRVGAHTWAVSTRHVGGKVGVVAGTERVLIVDAGADPVEGSAVAATAASVGRGPVTLLLTHGHWDHVRGWAGMAGIESQLHVDAWPSTRSQLAVAMKEPGAVEAIRSPSAAFDGEWTIDLGGVTVEILETPGHAPGSVCVLVREDGVLFGGDSVVTAIPPVFTDGHSTILERTLRRIAALDLAALVPGHGHVVRGPAAVRADVTGRAEYLGDMRARVEDLFGVHSEDEVATALALGDRAGGRFDADVASTDELRVRHERMVRALIGEVGMRPSGRSR